MSFDTHVYISNTQYTMHTFRKQVELRVVCGTEITRCTVLPTICNCTVHSSQCCLQFAIAKCHPQNFQIYTESARTMIFPPRPFELWGNIAHKAVGDKNLFIVWSSHFEVIIMWSFDHHHHYHHWSHFELWGNNAHTTGADEWREGKPWQAGRKSLSSAQGR